MKRKIPLAVVKESCILIFNIVIYRFNDKLLKNLSFNETIIKIFLLIKYKNNK